MSEDLAGVPRSEVLILHMGPTHVSQFTGLLSCYSYFIFGHTSSTRGLPLAGTLGTLCYIREGVWVAECKSSLLYCLSRPMKHLSLLFRTPG